MPIVFIHGVNNRIGEAYHESEAARNGFLRAIVAPALGLGAGDVFISSPYWGDEGAQFAWGMAVLPDSETNSEAFGDDNTPEVLGRVASSVPESPMKDGGSIAENAKRLKP